MICEVGEGTVHRLWEPLAAKQRPPNGYAAKFATPFILATGFVRGGVGLDAFTEEAVRDPAVLALAAKVRYVDRSRQSLSQRLHRPHPRVLNDGRVDRGAPAAFPRRRQRAADARRHRGEIRAQRAPRRLG